MGDGAKADDAKAESSSKDSKQARRAKPPSEAKLAKNSPAAANEDGSGSEQDADQEASRKRFVELLLQTHEISGSTTYAQAEKLLSSDSAWGACGDQTRRDCFQI